ncbi:non-ribosomal peptide synthetase [Brevibacillus antibioticus]|nr:non-ribosomal peptide synthetase [Brevibacillus antibioticus]
MKKKLLNFSLDQVGTLEQEGQIQIDEVSKRDVAIIGMSGKIAQADNLEELWNFIAQGKDCIRDFPMSRRVDTNAYLKYKQTYDPQMQYSSFGFLEEVDKFDYSFFNIPPNEAKYIDPNQRLFLQMAWEAMEDAGYGGDKLKGTNTAVYVGFDGDMPYKQLIADVEPDALAFALTGTLAPIIASRISYLLDLKGPSMLVNTACSSALVATYMACQEIRNGNFDMSLVGAVSLNLMPIKASTTLGLESSDGRSHTFDNDADGTGGGEGGGVIMLKSLSQALKDRDHIYAVIKGVAINQDGTSNGMTAPHPGAQEEVIVRAWKDARIDPETITYIESHGTGTKLGDPIELEGISRSFRRFTQKKHFCAVSSIKTNVGHLNHAAGIAGLLKAVLSLKNKQLAPSLHFRRPNKGINFINLPVYVNNELDEWKTDGPPRRCGISSFGLSGTNAHIVLEEAPLPKERIRSAAHIPHVLALSARSEAALRELVKRYAEFVASNDNLILEDVCYTANTGRGHYQYRLLITCVDLKELLTKLMTLLNANWNEDLLSYGIYCSMFDTMSGNLDSKKQGELTEDKAEVLNISISEKVDTFVRGNMRDQALLIEICQSYVRGGLIDWEAFYQHEMCHRISLPVYPFEKKRCWVDIPYTESPHADEDGLFHVIKWESSDLQPGAYPPKQGRVLLLADDSDISAKLSISLSELGREVIMVEQADEYQKLSDNHYFIDGLAGGYEALMDDLADNLFTQVVYLQTDRSGIHSLTEMRKTQKKGVYSLFQLLKAMLNRQIDQEIEVLLLVPYVHKVDNSEPTFCPEHAPLIGLGKVVGMESYNVTCRFIDIDGAVTPEMLAAEIQTSEQKYGVAYRNGKRYVEVLSKTDLTDTPNLTTDIRENGVYVITGGLGGLGLEIGKFLASKKSVKVCLIARSPLEDHSEWPVLLAQTQDEKLQHRYKTLMEMKRLGSEVIYYQADVSEEDALAQALDDIRSCFGPINGVIHCAGAVGEGLIIGKGEELFRSAIQPKVEGTWLLDRLTEEDQLDFFLSFSSITSLLGAPGHGAYSAANSYLDAFEAYRNKLGKRTVTINWAAWRDTGLAKDYGVNVDGLFRVLPTEEALQALEHVLSKDITRVVIGKVNYEDEVILSEFDSPMKLSDEILDIIEYKKQAFAPQKNALRSIELKTVTLIGRDNHTYTDWEQLVADIYGSVLGYDELDLNDNFYELGGDSIVAIKIVNCLYDKLKVKIELTQVLRNYPTIISLADFLESFYTSAEAKQYPPIVPVTKHDFYPVSAAQKRIFTLAQIDKENLGYNMPSAYLIEGDFDIQRFERVIHTLIARHESFRTSFEMINNDPVQIVHADCDFQIQYFTTSNKDIGELLAQFIAPFDLSKHPLIRIGLVNKAQDQHVLLIDMHHIISDGTSIGTLIQEFASLYEGLSLPKPIVQYKDFAVWQNRLLDSDLILQQEQFWLDTFSGELPLLELPTDYPRPAVMSYDGDNYDLEISPALTSKLRETCNKNDVTLFVLFLATYKLWLAKLTRQEDVIVGTPVIGRNEPSVEFVIGMFINTIALRTYPQGQKSFAHYLTEVRDNILMAFDNQEYQFEMLLEKLKLTRDLSRTPLFDTLFNMQNTSFDYGVKVGEMKFSPYLFENKTAKFDLTIHLEEMPDKVLLNCNYRTALFKPSTIQYLMNQYLNLLEQVVDNPNRPLEEYRLFEKSQLQTKNSVQTEVVSESFEAEVYSSIVQRFEEQVDKHAGAIAVKDKAKTYSYLELNQTANRIAHAILSYLPLTREQQPVAILFGHVAEMIVGMLGVLKTGNFYVPLDPTFPVDRLKDMLELSGARLIVTNHEYEDLAAQLAASDLEILTIQALEKNRNISSMNPNLPITAGQLAYIMFTSGSTGKPKAVMQTHHNVLHFIACFGNDLQISEDDRIALLTSYSHAVGVLDIFVAILFGAGVYPYNIKTEGSMDKLPAWLLDQQITFYHSIPTVFRYCMMAGGEETRYEHIRHVILGGEPVYQGDLALHQRHFADHSLLVNLYGASEILIATSYVLKHGSSMTGYALPVGYPVEGVEIALCNEQGGETRVFEIGEIVVKSKYLTSGYWKLENKTREVLSFDKDDPSVAVYRTNDLGRMLPDGSIEYIGRRDFQVKIRGYRVELGEIETILNHMDNIAKSAVIVTHNQDHEAQLVAYYETYDGKSLETVDVKNELTKYLPDYMVPTYLIHLDKIPLTPNYKIDKKSLPNIQTLPFSTQFVDAADETEEVLIHIWKDILGIESIGVNDNFFHLGGHSLKAAVLISHLHRAFDVEIPLREIFYRQTVRELASHIRECNRSLYTKIPKAEGRPYYPVSSAQKRQYVLHMFEGAQTSYNISRAHEIIGDVDVERLESILQQLINHHEPLRTSFAMIEGELVQVIQEDVTFAIEQLEADEDTLEWVAASFIRPFNLGQAPLLRVGIIRLSEQRHVLLYDLHHIIADATSVQLLLRNFFDLYNGQEMPPQRIQYKEFSLWQKEQLQSVRMTKQKAYWMETLSGDLAVLDLPTDFTRPLFRSYEGDTFSFKIDAELTGMLHQLTRETNSTLFMVLIATYNVLLAKYSGQNEIIVGTPIAGRNHADLEQMMGMFVNTLVLRNFPDEKKTFVIFLDEVKAHALQAFENQDYPFEELVNALNVKVDPSRNPLFDTMFTLQNMDMSNMSSDEIAFRPYEFHTESTQFDLQLEAIESEEGIHFNWCYCTKLFRRETMERMATHFVNLLQEITKNKERTIAKLNLLSQAEQEQLLNTFNQTVLAYEQDQTVVQLIEVQAVCTPDKTALVCGNTTLTYRELNERANRVARTLQSQGVQPSDIVGLIMQRSVEMIVGLLAILKAGAAYVPIDPDYPQDRIAYMLEDSQARALLTQQAWREKGTFNGTVICIDDALLDDASNLEKLATPTDPAYVIYTSGSTGHPKGIMIEHRSLVNFIAGIRDRIDFAANKPVLCVTTISFDIFFLEAILPLTVGAKVVIATEQEQQDMHQLARLIKEQHVNMLQMTPTRMQLLHAADDTWTKQVTEVMIGGEGFPLSLLTKLQLNMNARIFNMYGPTETTIWSVVHELTQETEIKVGTPIANTRLYILGEQLQLLPIGVVGELYIAGDGLAQGYFNRDDLTRERFVVNPYEDGRLMYQTGDLACWQEDGTVQCLGRLDHQVKLRGYRIELGEIEEVLLQHPDITESAVVDYEDESREKYLCVYYVTTGTATEQDVKEYLAQKLPVYFVPAYAVRLDQLPLTANGKINRKALVRPDYKEQVMVEYVAPRNEQEANITRIWQEVLGVERVGIKDDFFQLGGNSIKAIQISSALFKQNLQLDIRDTFQYPCISELAPHIHQLASVNDPIDSTGFILLAPMQRELANEIIMEPNSKAHSVMLYSREGFDPKLVTHAFTAVVNHHDALQMIFQLDDNELLQIHKPVDRAHFIFENLDIKADQDARAIIAAKVTYMKSHLAGVKPPFIRLGLFQTQEGDYLCILIHQLLMDESSWPILLEDFTQAYVSLMNKQHPVIEKKSASFREFVNHLSSHANQIDHEQPTGYWASLDRTRVPALPTDFDISTADSQNDAHILSAELSEEETYQLLHHTSHAYQTDINHLLLTGFGLALADWSNQQLFLIDVGERGRILSEGTLDLTRTVGWINSTLPLLLDMGNEKDLSYQIKNVKETLHRVQNGGSEWLLNIQKKSKTEKTNNKLIPSKNKICYNFSCRWNQEDLDFFQMDQQYEALSGHTLSNDGNVISLTCKIVEKRLIMSIRYSRSHYQKVTIRRLLEKYRQQMHLIIAHCKAKEDTELTPSAYGNSELTIEEVGEILQMFEK